MGTRYGNRFGGGSPDGKDFIFRGCLGLGSTFTLVVHWQGFGFSIWCGWLEALTTLPCHIIQRAAIGQIAAAHCHLFYL